MTGRDRFTIASLFLSDYPPGVNFSLRGSPRPRPPGLVFEGCPFGFLICRHEIAPRSWLHRSAPTRNFVAGCEVYRDQVEYYRTQKNEVAPPTPRARSARWLRATTQPPFQFHQPVAGGAARLGHREPASANEKHVVWESRGLPIIRVHLSRIL